MYLKQRPKTRNRWSHPFTKGLSEDKLLMRLMQPGLTHVGLRELLSTAEPRNGAFEWGGDRDA
jgi:hypothetical protein